MKTSIIIPARYESSRFPGKPLVDILGKSLVERVWGRCVEVCGSENVYVATDSDEIIEHCGERGIKSIMTSGNCLTGTDRVYEAAMQIGAELVVNVQGDEPLIEPGDIQKVINAHKSRPGVVHCGMCRIESKDDFRSSSVPKVVCGEGGRLFYMSRAGIPTNKRLGFRWAMKQVCIYAFPLEALEAFAMHGRKTPLEAVEDIEILRFMELGYEVEMVEVSQASIAVDFPEDVARAAEAIRQREVKG